MVSAHLTTRLIKFIHLLRDTGFNIGTRETIDVLTSLGDNSLTDKKSAHHIIRALSCHSKLEWQQFDSLFDSYWLPNDIVESFDEETVEKPQTADNQATGFSGSSHEAPDILNDISVEAIVGAGKQTTFSKADFRFLNNHKAMLEIEKLAEQLANKLNKRLSHQYQIKTRGTKIDIRQTIRRNLSQGGDPVRIFYRSRRHRPVHFVILHDVSHSMTWNNPLLFRFARGLMRTFDSSEAFAFHTELFKVSEFYRESSIDKMRRQLEARNHLWMGGTCIADSIAEFNLKHARRTLTSKTIFLIISDGFDTNNTSQLINELKHIRSKAKKIIWLNPMLGRKGYNPDEHSMLELKPYIDQHVPAHSLDSLKQAINYIAQECR